MRQPGSELGVGAAETGPEPLEDGRPIVFYDGECGLCDRMVRTLLQIDRKKRLRFASLQGETAQRMVVPVAKREGRELLGGMALLRGEPGSGAGAALEFDSAAALGCLEEAGGLWRVFGLLRLAPRFFRDAVYRWAAKRRYRWFGKAEVCSLPKAEDRSRFLP
ncbi:MAG TPA: DCC1-like thiol-disulfide oxidoreductase family protein [Verrucomicrobiales bacterium]|nr:DCC1-like thiol-disulfide oxidoreductase family protein [Verrucomicrobiales bacterium]